MVNCLSLKCKRIFRITPLSGLHLNDFYWIVFFWLADRSAYDEVISGEAEALDILTFVKEQMENGLV